MSQAMTMTVTVTVMYLPTYTHISIDDFIIGSVAACTK